MSSCCLLVPDALSISPAPCRGRRLLVLAAGPKCDICPISRVVCVELYKPKGRYGSVPMFSL